MVVYSTAAWKGVKILLWNLEEATLRKPWGLNLSGTTGLGLVVAQHYACLALSPHTLLGWPYFLMPVWRDGVAQMALPILGGGGLMMNPLSTSMSWSSMQPNSPQMCHTPISAWCWTLQLLLHHHHSFNVSVPLKVGRTAPMFVPSFFLHSILFAGSALDSFQSTLSNNFKFCDAVNTTIIPCNMPKPT